MRGRAPRMEELNATARIGHHRRTAIVLIAHRPTTETAGIRHHAGIVRLLVDTLRHVPTLRPAAVGPEAAGMSAEVAVVGPMEEAEEATLVEAEAVDTTSSS